MIEKLKVEKKKIAWGKRLNLDDENNNGPQLFSPSCVMATQDFTLAKELKIDKKKKLAEEKKIQQQEKKSQEKIEKKVWEDPYIVSKILRE